MATPLDNRIPPPVLTLLTGLAMGGASFVAPPAPFPDMVRVSALCAVVMFGAVFGASAFTAFNKARTTINPVQIENASSLVTTGIYRISRNPMYLGLTSLLVALALVLSNAWLLIGPLFFVLFTTRFQIIPEERVMQGKFGEAYTEYRRRVRRWL